MTKIHTPSALRRASKRVSLLTPDADGHLVGISRAPITITIPGNMAAAYRSSAYFYELSPYDEIFESLKAGAELALDTCARNDAPAASLENAWIMDGVDTNARPIAPSFSDDQRNRLEEAAHIVSQTTGSDVTVQDLIIAGALALLDHSSTAQSDAALGIGWTVEAYARRKATFAEPKYGTRNPLQSPDHIAA